MNLDPNRYHLDTRKVVADIVVADVVADIVVADMVADIVVAEVVGGHQEGPVADKQLWVVAQKKFAY